MRPADRREDGQTSFVAKGSAVEFQRTVKQIRESLLNDFVYVYSRMGPYPKRRFFNNLELKLVKIVNPGMKLSRFYLALVCLAAAVPLSAQPLEAICTTAPLLLQNRQNVVISNARIEDAPDDCIRLENCQNVLITNSDFARAGGEGIHIINCTSVMVAHCKFARVRTGVYAVGSQSVKVVRNRFLNVMGPMPRGQFVQFDKVSGAGNVISDNTGVNEPGLSNPEDAISIYKSTGLPGDPILVKNNRIRGGGPSRSGGGIMAGDSGGGYIMVRDNQLVDPGQYGIAVSGGHDISLIDNIIYGRQQPFTNVGLYVWNQNSDVCSSMTVRGNTVQWLNKDGKSNPAWNADNCGKVKGWSDNTFAGANIVVSDDFPETSLISRFSQSSQ